jgi:large exoprotein involved in heme utilization and adhesion
MHKKALFLQIQDSSIRNNIDSNAIGNPGDININTNSLLIENGAFLGTTTFGNGNAGNVIIQASESVQIMGGSLFTDVEENAVGNGGNISVETGQLRISDRAIVSAATLGIGNAGNISILASETVEIRDTSVIGTSTLGIGNAGNVAIQAVDSVRLINGDIAIDVAENGMGNGGTVEIDTARLEICWNGGQIIGGVRGQGNPGDIIVRASDAVTISGVTPDGEFR